jgi:hypothetical protein
VFRRFINGEFSKVKKSDLCSVRNVFIELVRLYQRLDDYGLENKTVFLVDFRNNCEEITKENYRECIEIVSTFHFEFSKLRQYCKDIALFLDTVCEAIDYLDDDAYIDKNAQKNLESMFVLKNIEQMKIAEKLNYIVRIYTAVDFLNERNRIHHKAMRVILTTDDDEAVEYMKKDEDLVKWLIFVKGFMQAL